MQWTAFGVTASPPSSTPPNSQTPTAVSDTVARGALPISGLTGGPDIPGRLCQELKPGLSCCLPCPITDWVYADYFQTSSDVASWVSVVGAICCVFLLLSYAVLPVEKTGRHYLSISIVSAVIFMHVSSFQSLLTHPLA